MKLPQLKHFLPLIFLGLNLLFGLNSEALGQPFIEAVADGKTEQVRRMVSQPYNFIRPQRLDGKQVWAVELACEKNNLEILKILVEAGASVHLKGPRGDRFPEKLSTNPRSKPICPRSENNAKT